MKKKFSILLLLIMIVQLFSQSIVFADKGNTYQDIQEKIEVRRLVHDGVIDEDVADRVKLIGFTPHEQSIEDVYVEKMSYNELKSSGTWVQSNSKWRYKQPDGTYFKNGWLYIDSNWYYFVDEIMQTGWKKVNNAWYYLMLSGKMVTGLYNIDGKNYFFREKGEWVENTGEAMSLYAQTFVGKLPYVWGGSSLTKGADCSGFTMAIHRTFGISIHKKSLEQVKDGVAVSRASLKPGDICVYGYGGNSGHVTMYIGNNKVVQESDPNQGCNISSLSNATGKLLGYRRCWK